MLYTLLRAPRCARRLYLYFEDQDKKERRRALAETRQDTTAGRQDRQEEVHRRSPPIIKILRGGADQCIILILYFTIL